MKTSFALWTAFSLAVCAWLAPSGLRADVIADSMADWSFTGTQGENNWTYGYRDLTADGGGPNYNPTTGFIAFPSEYWTGTIWDWPNGNPPWTEIGQEAVHPAGPSPAHWCIRRWVSEVTQTAPVQLTYHARKGNPGCGNGVTSGVWHNGQRIHESTIAFDDTTGVTVTCYANVSPGDAIDVMLSPQGTDAGLQDGCDGSFFTLVVDTTIPPDPLQPDGTPFIPFNPADSDVDGLPDSWEQGYFPGNLAALTGTGDNDTDGLNNTGEYQRDSNPTLADTDGDTLSDLVETKTGTFVSASNTGTNPRVADTDGDGLRDDAEVTGSPATNPNLADSDSDTFNDREEIFFGSNPNSATDTPLTFVIGDSRSEFSGVPAQDGWTQGYRNHSLDGGTEDYDPTTGFIAYAGGDGQGPWDGVAQQWTGTSWNLKTDYADNQGPWTTQEREGLHPNGANSLPNEEHWNIRRWTATEVTQVTPVALIWHTRRGNTCGSGVTGALHINGLRVDSQSLPAVDPTGFVRHYFANLMPGDRVDLVLTPVSEGGDRGDGCDGSANWLRIDKRLPAVPTQPDGSIFIPANSPDSDADGLPDFWENIYAPGNLATLTGTGDNDTDGSTNTQELQRSTHPIDADSDDDLLNDGVETHTGTFVSATNTGSNPRDSDTDDDGRLDGQEVAGPPTSNPVIADTDGDTFNDGAEVAAGSDPNNPASNPDAGLIANSITDFSASGTQGENGWSYGYRNVTLDGHGQESYDPAADFIPFTEDFWTGTGWDWPAGNPPWTEIQAQDGHPNGVNNTDVHWCIRRWASEVTQTTPLALRYHIRKTNAGGGNGTTGAVFLNGQLLDSHTVAFNDATGVIRTYYALVNPGDVIDLILSPRGTDGSDDDGADGSGFWLKVDGNIPPNPTQPDGTPFDPTGSPPPRFTSINRDPATGVVTVVWSSVPGATYAVDVTTTLVSGSRVELVDGIPSGGATTTFTDNAAPAGARYYFVRPD